MSETTFDTRELVRGPARARTGGGNGAATALGVAAGCLLAMALIWALAELVPAVHLRDASTLYHFTLLDRPRIDASANLLLELLEPTYFILWSALLVLVALGRRRPRTALAVVAVTALAPFTAETLKPLLAHPHATVGGVHIGPASWPSGHATAAVALALSAVLVAPARWRAAVALVGGVFSLAVGVSLLILAWHMPSDVLGGYLLGTFWTALALAAVRASERRWPSRAARRRAGDEAKPDAEGARGERLAPLHGSRAEA